MKSKLFTVTIEGQTVHNTYYKKTYNKQNRHFSELALEEKKQQKPDIQEHRAESSLREDLHH